MKKFQTIDSYLRELERRLRSGVPASKQRDLVSEIESHLMARGAELAAEGKPNPEVLAIEKFGPVEKARNLRVANSGFNRRYARAALTVALLIAISPVIAAYSTVGLSTSAMATLTVIFGLSGLAFAWYATYFEQTRSHWVMYGLFLAVFNILGFAVVRVLERISRRPRPANVEVRF